MTGDFTGEANRLLDAVQLALAEQIRCQAAMDAARLALAKASDGAAGAQRTFDRYVQSEVYRRIAAAEPEA